MNDSTFRLRRLAVSGYGPTLLFAFGEGAMLPVVTLRARDLGASVAMAAMVLTLIGIGSLTCNIPASLITMHRGERWAIVAAAIWCALAMLLCALTHSLPVFAAGTFMVGMSQAVFGLARQSYLTDAVPVDYRAQAMSTLGGVMRVGLFAGPFAGALAIAQWGLTGAYGVGVVALVLSALVAIRLPDLDKPGPADSVHPQRSGRAPSLTSIVRDHRGTFITLGIGVLLVSAVRAARQAVIPLWADSLLLPASTASMVYGLAGGIETLVFYPAGKVMDKRGRLWVAVPSMLIMGVALLLTPLTVGATGLLLAAAAIGFGNGIGSGLVMTLGADYSPRDGRAHFLGVWRLMSDLGSTCGPALLSLIAAVLTLGTGIAVTGLIAFAAAAQLAYWVPRVSRGRD